MFWFLAYNEGSHLTYSSAYSWVNPTFACMENKVAVSKAVVWLYVYLSNFSTVWLKFSKATFSFSRQAASLLWSALLQQRCAAFSVWIYIQIFLIRAAAPSNGQFKDLLVCWGPYAGWQMFISQLAFHLSMENNGLAFCPPLSWANKASYLTSEQTIIHLQMNTWDQAGVHSNCQVLDKLLRRFCIDTLLFVYQW